MSTLLIAGGLLVDELSVRRADLLVQDGRVKAILQPGHGQTADEVLDANGLHVLPGVVDAHVHFNEPGRTDWEGFLTGTTAAAAGGVTTVCDMPLNCHPPTLDARALTIKRSAVVNQALIDYAFWGGVVPDSLAHLQELHREGVIGVKAFLCDSGLAEYPHLDDFSALEAMQACAEMGLLLALHAEDAAETGRLGQQARAEGRRGALDWARSRPPTTEFEAVRRALELAQETGARLHFVHISTGGAARLIAAARAAGQDVSGETCPHYLCLDESDLAQLQTLGKCAPPLRSRAEVEDLWRALLEGALDWIASDHSPCPPSMKQTDDIWAAWGGLAGVQTLLPALLTEAVHARGLSLPRLVSLIAGTPARRLGLYPRKGVLEPGADADIAMVDLHKTWTLQAQDLRTRWPINPFVGRTFTGQVRATVVRGAVVWQDGAARVAAGYGPAGDAMTTLSTHVLDIERGAPASGVPIALFRGDQPLASAETNADGRIPDLANGVSLEAGSYRLVFDVETYFTREGRPAPFLQRVSLEFQVNAADAHYHVPLLLSPYACTAYRGS